MRLRRPYGASVLFGDPHTYARGYPVPRLRRWIPGIGTTSVKKADPPAVRPDARK